MRVFALVTALLLATSGDVGIGVSGSGTNNGGVVVPVPSGTGTWCFAYAVTGPTWVRCVPYTGTVTGPATVAPGSCVNTPATVTGAVLGKGCHIGAPATAPATPLTEFCYVSAANVAQLHICNVAAAGLALTPPAGTYTLYVDP